MGNLLLPVGPRRMSSWETHQHRSPRSSEPGTDFYCPIGTPVVAPANGRVYGYGESIIPATGLWVGLDLENGMRFRAMHFSRIALSKTILNNRGFVRRGQIIGYSGATGYGDKDWSWNPNTGGAHTHVTLWPTWNSRYGYDAHGRPYTVDFMKYADLSASSGSGVVVPTPEAPIVEEKVEDEEMSKNVLWQTTDDKFKIRAAVGNDVSGLWIEVTSDDAGITNTLASRYETGDALVTSRSAFQAARASHAAVRPRGDLNVTVGEA